MEPQTDAQLRRQLIHYLKTCQPKEFKRMEKEDKLEGYILLKIKATRSYAESLIHSGEFPEQAWYRAVCLEICQTEKD